MNRNGKEIALDGDVYEPTIDDEELATDRSATVLRFRLEVPPPQGPPGDPESQDVIMRGNDRIHGTVFESDRVRVFGWVGEEVGEEGVLVATRIEDTDTGVTVRPGRGYAAGEAGDQPLFEGSANVVVPSKETHGRRSEGSRQSSFSVVNIRVDTDPSPKKVFRNVELRGAPDISGKIYTDDKLRVFGDVSEDGLVRAARIEKPGAIGRMTTVRPVRRHDPRPWWRRMLSRTWGIVLLIIVILFILFVILSMLGSFLGWDLPWFP